MKLQVFKERITNPTIRVRDAQSLTSRTADGEQITNIDSLIEAENEIKANELAHSQGFENIKPEDNKDISIRIDQFEEILIYPNPANRYLSIANLKNSCKFELYDFTGRLITSKQLEMQTEKIELPQVSNGVYTIKLIFENNSYNAKVNIIQHAR
jgi:hypothetical protein